jgi:hypothetical protein
MTNPGKLSTSYCAPYVEGASTIIIRNKKKGELFLPYVPLILGQLLDLISLAKISNFESRFESYDHGKLPKYHDFIQEY